MKDLFRYLKPYWPLILVAVVLLFIQANADLALPDYLSRIVNNGIQAGGIESAVPQAVRKSEMDRLVLFMTSEEKTTVLEHYTLVDPKDVVAGQYVQTYPVLADEPVYVLDNLSKAEVELLEPMLARALLGVSFIRQVQADPQSAAGMAEGLGIDLSKIPTGMDLFTVFGSLPEPQLAQIRTAMNQRTSQMSEQMVTQVAAEAVKSEYLALGVDLGKLQTDYILRVGGMMLLVTLIAGVSTVTVSYLAARTSAGYGRDVRKGVFSKVESFSNTEFDRFSTASLITRSTNDITQIQMVVFMIIRMVIYAPIVGVGGIIRALGKGTSMWWIIVLAVGILLTVILVVFSIALPKFKSIQNLIDRLNLVMRENLSGIMVIRAFNRQEFELERFDKANTDLTSTMLFINRIMVVMMPLMMFIMNGVSILIIWIGSHQVAQANMQVGDMIAFLQYTMQIVFAFLMLSMMFIILPRATVSARRIAEVLDTEAVIKDPDQPIQFTGQFHPTIEFKNVSFRYPDAEEDVLHDISFTANPGQTTAFIGSTGSGKSTIVNLIPRFYDVTGGSILVSDTDVREVSQHALRDKIGYIPQKGVLFSGTIESNLRYADENANMDTLQEAVGIAQAAEFISNNGGGFNAEISQGGTNVSGGQKQRLSIARALVKKPPIYIFDDSFSAVDYKTDSALRRALKEKTADSTLLIVTQRVSTIKNAEQIIVLEEGRVVGKGTHQELMRDCKAYQEIATSQLSQEELR